MTPSTDEMIAEVSSHNYSNELFEMWEIVIYQKIICKSHYIK